MPTIPPLLGDDSEEQYRAQFEQLEALILVDAVAALEQVEVLANQVRGKYVHLEGQCLCLKGSALFFQSKYEESLPEYEMTLTFAEQHGDEMLRARALNGLGNVYCLQGNSAKGMDYYYESARISRKNDDAMGWQRSMNNIGLMYCQFGAYQEALQIHSELAQTAIKNGLLHQESVAKVNIVVAYGELGEYHHVLNLAQKYLEDSRFDDLHQHHVVILVYQADALCSLEQLNEARQVVECAIELATEIKDLEYMALAMLTKGKLYKKSGELELAQKTINEALDITIEYGIYRRQGQLYEALAGILEENGHYQEANASLRKYYEIDRKMRTENMEHRIKLLKIQNQLDALQNEIQQAKHDALHDALTGLANRAHFREVTEQYLKFHPNALTGFVFIDLDNFKYINDTYGHIVGDEFLIQVAQRIKNSVPPHVLVSRRGGDEFTLLLKNCQNIEEIEKHAKGVLKALSFPFSLVVDPMAVPVPLVEDFIMTASMGVSIAPRDGQDFLTLERRADLAMYKVKDSGKNNICLFQKNSQNSRENYDGQTASGE